MSKEIDIEFSSNNLYKVHGMNFERMEHSQRVKHRRCNFRSKKFLGYWNQNLC